MHNVHMHIVPSRVRVERLCTNHIPSKFSIPTVNHKAHSRSLSLIPHSSSSSGLDSQGLFSSNSSLLGPSAPSMGPSTGSQAATSLTIDDVPLESGADVDYITLRDLLKAGKWREAEDETRAKLIQAAGPGAQKRNWVYWSEIKSIPDADMTTMDKLWRASSNGRFGYTVQREMWIQNNRQWTKFFKAIDWVQGENNIYRKWPQEFKYKKDAPKGHLPLTNCLRGTRLFESVMEHPAIAGAKKEGGAGDASSPDWLKSS